MRLNLVAIRWRKAGCGVVQMRRPRRTAALCERLPASRWTRAGVGLLAQRMGLRAGGGDRRLRRRLFTQGTVS